MKNKGIVIFLIILTIVIVAVIAIDYSSERPNKSEANPYEYDIDEYKNVDSELINYKETKNFKIGFENPTGIAVKDDKIYITGDKSLKIIDFSGNLLNEISIQGEPKTVEPSGDTIFVATANKILVFTPEGTLLNEWNFEDENSFITAVSIYQGNVFVADAGLRKVYRFSEDGKLLNEFEGKKGDEVVHGFIVPSPYFDLGVNEFGELWIANPGMHSLENYTFDGDLRGFWEYTSIEIEGFSGCCNPAHFTFLDDGSFVTSEKGLVRIKIHKPSGELKCVVAAPVKFKDGGEAPDVAVDSLGNVYALDFDRKIIRVFEPITN
jgi:hypothetical protein